MTEPNNLQVPETESPEPERPEVHWPDDVNPTGDALVDRAMVLLDGVPKSPVSEHGELYAGIHDSLLEALDAEPGLPHTANRTPTDPRPEGES